MDVFLGTINGFAIERDIRYWKKCEGQMLNIKDEGLLFALLGTTYGGDGVETFALPDIPADEYGINYFICVSGPTPIK